MIGPTPTPTARVSSTPGPSCTPAIVALLVPVTPMSALPPPARQTARSPPSSLPAPARPSRVRPAAESRYSAGARSGARTWILRRTSSERPACRANALTIAVRPGVVQPSVCSPRLIQSARYGRSTRLTTKPQVRRLVATCEEKPRIARRGDDVARSARRVRRPVRSPSRARASRAGRACTGSSRPRRRRHA